VFGRIGKRKTTPVLGLDVSSTTVKLLELSFTGDRYRVESYAVSSLPQDAVIEKNVNDVDGVANAIRSVVAQSRTKLKTVAAAVAGSSVITKLIDMPQGLSEDEMETQLTLEADQYIPYPLEEVSIDFEVQGPSPERDNMVEVLLAACRRETIDTRVEAIESAELIPRIMDVEAYAMERAFSLIRHQLDLEEESTVAVVDIGASIMNITVLRNDQAVYSREQQFGGNQLTQDIARHYGLSSEEAENAKRSGGLPDSFDAEVLRPFMENAALEIQRAMQFFFTSTQFNSIEHILLTGGTSTLAGFEDVVSSRSRINAMVANPFANMSISPRIQLKKLISDAPALMIACGLAMRRFDE